MAHCRSPICFDNTKRCEQGTGNTPEAQSIGEKYGCVMGSIAATGNPSIPGLSWEPTNPKANRTMIWDNQSRMADDPDGAIRRIILA
jgi:para-nitrobenzyl esterase